MQITLHPPAALHEVGGRKNNEDFIYPAKGQAGPGDRLFVVCDGVGGSEKGEIASQLVSQAIGAYFEAQPLKGRPDQAYLEAALKQAEARLSEHLRTHPECKGMGTTLTLLYLGADGATMAWAGDSRIYHFRGEDCLFQSEDHSLVNELVKQNVITEAQAASHPQKNVILRAVRGSEEPAELDIVHSAELQAGDYFLLCTDGVLEQVGREHLAEWFGQGKSASAVSEAIYERCQGHSKDNFSAYVLQLDQVKGAPPVVKSPPAKSPAVATTAAAPTVSESLPIPREAKMKPRRPWLTPLIILLVIAGSYALYRLMQPSEAEKEKLAQAIAEKARIDSLHKDVVDQYMVLNNTLNGPKKVSFLQLEALKKKAQTLAERVKSDTIYRGLQLDADQLNATFFQNKAAEIQRRTNSISLEESLKNLIEVACDTSDKQYARELLERAQQINKARQASWEDSIVAARDRCLTEELPEAEAVPDAGNNVIGESSGAAAAAGENSDKVGGNNPDAETEDPDNPDR